MADSDDLAEVEVLTDDILAQCLNERYQLDKIYTYVGDILIAVNPFQELGLYTNAVSARYCNILSKQDQPPHLFAIADAAFHNMVRNNKSQVCVISGESGAGKTESAKQFVRQIMDISARGVMGGGEEVEGVEHKRAKHPVETKIIQQNPILESFGNAKTVMNDNSSRFGKFIDLKFGKQGTVTGADMSHYLLEKARIVLLETMVMQGPGERNYHIFGMLFTGLDRTSLDMYGLTEMTDFNYMPQDSGDAFALMEMWNEMQQAFKDCGFTDKEKDEMYSVLAGVLHLGNLVFEDGDEGDAAVVQNMDRAETISRILMIDQNRLLPALMTSIINMRGEVITKKNNIAKCTNATSATAKSLYDKLFQWIVFKINLTLRPETMPEFGSTTIGILDIFGFENFEVNGFDQMCINLANEQLHYFFNQHIFAAELGSYAAEGLELSADVMFHDNKAVLDLFFRRTPPGLLNLLDEECRFPKASESSLLNKFDKNLKEQDLYNEIKGNYAFGVSHYAGDIKYHAKGFLEKNSDPLPDLIPPACESSHNSLLKMLFSSDWSISGGALGARGKSKIGNLFGTKKKNFMSRKRKEDGNKSMKSMKSMKSVRRQQSRKDVGGKGKDKTVDTVSAAFRASLAMLMMKMGQCEPHFVRCIKPNPQKKPHIWDPKLVLRQLTYTGMLQTVKMRREGFPFRIPFSDFFHSYHGIVYDFMCPMQGNAQTCTELLERLEEKVEAHRQEHGLATLTSKLSGWKVAKTMVFLKYWQLDLLNSLTHPFDVAALKIQTQFRMFNARRKFLPMKMKYADECAMAATFVTGISNGVERFVGWQMNLLEEEERRGPIGLGIAKPVEQKVLKKAQKEMAKAEVQVDAKKFEKDLNKVKKGVVKWWIKFERVKGNHVDESGKVYPWFHGLISRTDAEEYLFDQPTGAFLIRVSERVHGYALSFRHGNRIRHYKLGFSRNGGYEVVGNSEEFATLIELVEFFHDSPVTPGDTDRLTEAVEFDHDLGLGISQDDNVTGKAPAQRMTKEQREERTKTMMTFDDQGSGEPMAFSEFLEDVDNKPRWLRGKISRHESEKELQNRGQVDGRFLVREKLRTADRIVLALSVSFRQKFYHHLLTRQLQGNWYLDEKPMDYSNKLEEVIRYLQKKKSPRLATVLEQDVPDAPENVVDMSFKERKPKHAPEQQRSNLVPSSTSTVDDVVAWLASLGLAKYAGGFYKAKFDGAKLHKATAKQLRKIVKHEDDYVLMVRALR